MGLAAVFAVTLSAFKDSSAVSHVIFAAVLIGVSVSEWVLAKPCRVAGGRCRGSSRSTPP